jgi:hypothetical protein
MIRILAILALTTLAALAIACGDDDDDDDGGDTANGTVSEADQLCADLAALTAAINEFDSVSGDTTLEELDLLADNLASTRQAVSDSAEEAFEAEVTTLESSLDTLEDDLQLLREDGPTEEEVATAQDSAAAARTNAEALTTAATCS